MKPYFDLSLYVITDKLLAGKKPVTRIVLEAIENGATIIQYREKTALPNEMLAQARIIHQVTNYYHVPLIINDRTDIMLAVNAQGIHIGQKDMPACQVRKIIGPDKILGVSALTTEEARKAQNDGADYLGIGPVFPTDTKINAAPPIGIAMVKKIIKAVKIPTVGIGGINDENAASVIKSGAKGIAVISAIMKSANPGLSAKLLKKIVLDAQRRKI